MTQPNSLPLIVTGAASGIGAETCRQLRAAGTAVIGVDRNEAQDFDGDFIRADLSTPEGVDAVVSRLPERVAGLINIAGVPGTAPMELVLGVNVIGLRLLTEAVAPRIMEDGVVVNLSSAVADGWRADWAATRDLAMARDPQDAVERAGGITAGDSYRRSKEAVRFLTEYFAAQLVERHVRVVSVSPGPVSTPILEDFKNDHGRAKVDSAAELLGRFGRPEDIAAVVVFLASPDAGWINGTDVRVDGGLNAWRSQNA